MDPLPKINIVTIGNTADGPTVFIRQYCERRYIPGIIGTEGEPDVRTCVLEDQSVLVDLLDISRCACRADGNGADVKSLLQESDALIAVLEPAKPGFVEWVEDVRFSTSAALIDEEKTNGSLTETVVVLLWHEDEACGMKEEEQREVGRQKAQSYAARAGGDVEIYFAHAFSGAGVDEAVEGTVVRVIQRKRAAEAKERAKYANVENVGKAARVKVVRGKVARTFRGLACW